MSLNLRIPYTVSSFDVHIKNNQFSLLGIYQLLQEHTTLTFRVDNFTYSSLTECRIPRGNVHLCVSVVKDLRASVNKCVVKDLTAAVTKCVHC